MSQERSFTGAETLSRAMIAESDVNHSPWWARSIAISKDMTTLHHDEDELPMTTERSLFLSSLQDALESTVYDGREIPAYLEKDQVEDWFIGQAVRKALDIKRRQVAMLAALAERGVHA